MKGSKFELGDVVLWRSQSAGHATEKTGTIVAVVPPGERIGTRTPFGTIQAVLFLSGERYYMMIDASGCVSLMPAVAVESGKGERG